MRSRTFEELHSEVGLCIFPGCGKPAEREGSRARGGAKIKRPEGAVRLWYCKRHREIGDAEWNLAPPDQKVLDAEKDREREGKRNNAKKWSKIRKSERRRGKTRKRVRWIVKTGTRAMRAMGKDFSKCSDCSQPPLPGKRRCGKHMVSKERCYECPKKPAPGKTRCEKHLAESNHRRKLARSASPMTRLERKQRTSYMLSYREKKRGRGECYECKKPSVRGGRCEVHADRHDEVAAFCASNGRSKGRGSSRPMREQWYDLE